MRYELVEGESLRARLERGALSWPDAVQAVRALAAALHHAHGAGVLHRDVKPENVLIAGQPPFAAASLSTLLSAHLNDPPPPLSSRVPGVPPALESAVRRALAKQPADRWPDAATFGNVLEALLADPDAAVPAPAAQLEFGSGVHGRTRRPSAVTRASGRSLVSRSTTVVPVATTPRRTWLSFVVAASCALLFAAGWLRSPHAPLPPPVTLKATRTPAVAMVRDPAQEFAALAREYADVFSRVDAQAKDPRPGLTSPATNSPTPRSPRRRVCAPRSRMLPPSSSASSRRR